MNASENCLKIIKFYEGFKANAYLCPANVWTIGYGTTHNVKRGMIVSETQAAQMLRNDVKSAESTVDRLVKVPLNQGQYDALVCFIYNLGEGNFRSSTLLKKLNAKDYAGASMEFQRWNKASGKVLAGLVKRRASEEILFRFGFVLI